jgi:hypothetical protein
MPELFAHSTTINGDKLKAPAAAGAPIKFAVFSKSKYWDELLMIIRLKMAGTKCQWIVRQGRNKVKTNS